MAPVSFFYVYAHTVLNFFQFNCCLHVSVWQRIYQQEIEVLLTRDQTDWEQYMKELLEKEVRTTQKIKHRLTHKHARAFIY